MIDNDENASHRGANGDSHASSPLLMLLVFVVLIALVVLYGVFSS